MTGRWEVHSNIKVWYPIFDDDEDVFAVVWKEFSLFKVIINESLNLKASLMISIFMIPQYSSWRYEFSSKLHFQNVQTLGEVGRVDRKIFVQTYFCPLWNSLCSHFFDIYLDLRKYGIFDFWKSWNFLWPVFRS